MADGTRKSIYQTEAVWDIVDKLAEHKGCNRSKLIWHLIVYAGLCGGDYPLTSRIDELPDSDRDRILDEILANLSKKKFPKVQAFGEWVRESGGDPEVAARSMVDDLLGNG